MKIVILGAGNVATHIGMAFKKAKHDMVQVYSRSHSSARELALALKCTFTTELTSISPSADVYVVAITDHAIKGVLKSLPVKKQLILHTSGSVPMSIFGRKFRNHGVLYPLQTFSKNRNLKFSEVPLLIEGNSPQAVAKIATLSGSVSPFVFEMSSSDRKSVHLAAVMVNNFSNHLFVLAEKVLMKKNLPFPLLGPLMHETVIKAIKLGPREAQTGPAKRGDSKTMEEHLALLKKEPEMQKIYKLISAGIEEESGIRL